MSFLKNGLETGNLELANVDSQQSRVGRDRRPRPTTELLLRLPGDFLCLCLLLGFFSLAIPAHAETAGTVGGIPREPPLAAQGYIIDRLVAVFVDGHVYYSRTCEKPAEPLKPASGEYLAAAKNDNVRRARADSTRRFAVQPGQLFVDGDTLYTDEHAWVVLSFSTNNLIMLKPRGELRLRISESVSSQGIKSPGVAKNAMDGTDFSGESTQSPADGTRGARAALKLRVEIKQGALMLAARDSDRVEAVGARSTFFLKSGEAACRCDGMSDEIFALRGTVFVRPVGAAQPTSVPESYALTLDADGKESAVEAFDAPMMYEEFRRFRTWLSNFDTASRMTTGQITYRVDDVFINDRYLSNLETDENGFRIVDPGASPAPRLIHLRLKLTPYPAPSDRFELVINKDLSYALREGREGFFEAKIPLPSLPEFTIRIVSLDSRDRRDRVFECRFTMFNRHRKIDEIRAFLDRFSQALQRRDEMFLRDHVSRAYRDAFGHSYFDFTRALEDTLHAWRDIRLVMHPHSFVFRDGVVQVDMQYRLTALTGNWNYRYEDVGNELMTLEFTDGDWRLKAKRRGLLFQRMKVTLDLRLGVLRGRVTDELSGNGIVGASVKLVNTTYRAQTDSMGEYVFYHLPPGKYDVEISRNGYGKILVQKVDVYAIGRRF
ncbi:MAG: carboxypeptidase-like regulatory domain-containing protein [Candidatus Ozemobacteraceae bacterium]